MSDIIEEKQFSKLNGRRPADCDHVVLGSNMWTWSEPHGNLEISFHLPHFHVCDVDDDRTPTAAGIVAHPFSIALVYFTESTDGEIVVAPVFVNKVFRAEEVNVIFVVRGRIDDFFRQMRLYGSGSSAQSDHYFDPFIPLSFDLLAIMRLRNIRAYYLWSWIS